MQQRRKSMQIQNLCKPADFDFKPGGDGQGSMEASCSPFLLTSRSEKEFKHAESRFPPWPSPLKTCTQAGTTCDTACSTVLRDAAQLLTPIGNTAMKSHGPILFFSIWPSLWPRAPRPPVDFRFGHPHGSTPSALISCRRGPALLSAFHSYPQTPLPPNGRSPRVGAGPMG